ncbi:hypothetical protein So717_38170 [Roseobacter cerasinus]|uniref:Uncharacterized protein n=1 Tax=Roseobacter cerasinus TaxID=2602289 RepID=A0A640VWS9_9RHOB|nr:hypothetical protein [Roseobacter cerasinus]GFE52064.1 hypothetical protein So717_38170 [Roseobacter cerasinus]
MSDQTQQTSSSSNTGLAFIVGMLVVVVGVLAYFMLAGDAGISVEGPDTAIEGAAEAIAGD